MKKLIILTAVFAAFTLMAFAGNKVHVDVYQVDTKLSSLEWYAEKVTGKHNGTIMLSKGEVKSDHGNFSGNFEIDMNTIEDKDMEAGKGKERLEKHLKSPDFFDAEKFPTCKFVISSVTPIKDVKEGGFTHTVKGMLTIKDKTNEIVFDAVIILKDNKALCTGTAVVDRSKFDVRYGSKTFFEDIGDKMIYDEFNLRFNVVAVKL